MSVDVSDNPVKTFPGIMAFANGMPVTSEAESFPDLAARVRAKDAAKGEILEKGLDDIKAHPTTAQTKAKELLKKL